MAIVSDQKMITERKINELQMDIEVIYFYLFIILEPTLSTVGSLRINAKERQARRVKKGKGIEAQRVKHATPSRATDALIGDEE